MFFNATARLNAMWLQEEVKNVLLIEYETKLLFKLGFSLQGAEF